MTSELETEWEAQEPSAGFAERVVAAAVRERRGLRTRRYAIAGVALAVAAAAGLVLFAQTPASSGEVAADRRIEAAIGSRAVAVLEPGAHIAWHGDVINQDRGEVFYRVEPGSTFEVHTPSGDVSVLGTCFRIAIDPKESTMKRRDFGVGALGAVVAATVVVGVYEGKVKVAHGKDVVTLQAGEQAIADAQGVRTDRARPIASAPDKPDNGVTRTVADLRDRLSSLEQEKAALELQLASAKDGVTKNPYDLSPDDWGKLAEQGKFKYQMPCFQPGGFRPSVTQLERLGLDASDGDAIHEAYRRSNENWNTDIRTICSEAFGGEQPDAKDCMMKLFTNVYANGDPKPAFTELAEIRAGKRKVPKDASPETRMLLLLSGAMKPFEDDLARTFGAEEAHRIAYSEDLCFQSNTMQ